MGGDATAAGQKIADRFLLLSVLGKGGAATVWRARDLELSREVALKLPHRPVRVSRRARDRFRSECEILARLDHPSLCPILDFDSDGPIPWLSMPMAEGVGLHEAMASHCRAGTSFRPQECVYVLEQLCSALSAAHSRGVVHRDLKPSNVLVALNSTDPQVRILDFGIARVMNAEASAQTTVGRVIGTYAYMSPEQASGQPIDARTDVFSLAVIAYEMLTLRRPWILDDAGEPHRAYASKIMLVGPNAASRLMERMASGFVALPSVFRPNLTHEIEALLQRAVARDPEERPRDAGAFWEALGPGLKEWASWAEDEETLARPARGGAGLRPDDRPQTALRLPEGGDPVREPAVAVPEAQGFETLEPRPPTLTLEVSGSPSRGRSSRRLVTTGLLVLLVTFVLALALSDRREREMSESPTSRASRLGAGPSDEVRVRAVAEPGESRADEPRASSEVESGREATQVASSTPTGADLEADASRFPVESGRADAGARTKASFERRGDRRRPNPPVQPVRSDQPARPEAESTPPSSGRQVRRIRRLRASIRAAETSPDRLALGAEIGENIFEAAFEIQDLGLRSRIQALAKSSALVGDYHGLERAVSLLEDALHE